MSKTAEQIRNFALIGHSGEGKTSLAEAILFNAGAIDRMGTTNDGTSVMDYDAEEISRKISIGLSIANCTFKDIKFNIIDVPGFFDFEGEMTSALHVADGAIIVVGSDGQLAVGTEKALDYCIKNKKPCMIFVNQIDKENADYYKTFDCINEKYPNKLAPVQVPILDDNHKMVGYVNVIKETAYKFIKDGREPLDAIPDGIKGEYEKVREELIERAAETDPALMEKFFSGEGLTEEEIIGGVKKAILDGQAIPIVAGSATQNKGVINLMVEIIHYLPMAQEQGLLCTDKVGELVEIVYNPQKPLVMQVFKTIADPFVGKLSYFKVLRGTIKSGDTIYNSRADKTEKASNLYVVRGKKQEPVDELCAGDIGALAKLAYTSTGDTLCAPDRIMFAPEIDFPKPVISLAINATKQGEDEKVIAGLNKLSEEDCTFSIDKNVELNETLLSGMGETHIDIIVKKLKNKFNVDAKLRDPRISYRETIKKTVQVQGKHKKQSGGHGQYGDCWIRFEPNPGMGFEFGEEVVGGSVPKQYIPAVEKGLRECIAKGVLAGYPMVDLKAVLYDGSYHDVDSSEMAFKIAASIAYKEGCAKANPVLLEPIMMAEVLVPDSYMGDILGDISKRRGRILGADAVDGMQKITAEVPHAEMFKYATDLRSMTQGRGKFSMSFVRYEEVPVSMADKIIAEAKARREAE